ncbi:hypothetical protein ACFLV3_01690 [Chloroflexota bacterium]
MKEIIKAKGKANQVFKYVEQLSRNKGKVTLKEWERYYKTIKLDFRS